VTCTHPEFAKSRRKFDSWHDTLLNSNTRRSISRREAMDVRNRDPSRLYGAGNQTALRREVVASTPRSYRWDANRGEIRAIFLLPATKYLNNVNYLLTGILTYSSNLQVTQICIISYFVRPTNLIV